MRLKKQKQPQYRAWRPSMVGCKKSVKWSSGPIYMLYLRFLCPLGRDHHIWVQSSLNYVLCNLFSPHALHHRLMQSQQSVRGMSVFVLFLQDHSAHYLPTTSQVPDRVENSMVSSNGAKNSVEIQPEQTALSIHASEVAVQAYTKPATWPCPAEMTVSGRGRKPIAHGHDELCVTGSN